MPKGKFHNDIDAPLSVAVWLAADEYDFTPAVNAISCTDLLKSDRQLVLRSRRMEVEAQNPTSPELIALSGRVASRMGHAIHNDIEKAWMEKRVNALVDLGYPERVAKQVVVNPTKDQVDAGCIPIYMEIRNTKEIEGITVSGKYDFIGEGRIEDFKSTSVFTYKNQTNNDKYILQGSIYRWLNPDIVTDDTMQINYIFTDWSKNMARASKDGSYPDQRIKAVQFNLLSVAETEHYIRSKLCRVANLRDTPEADLPDCNSEELWEKESVFKYYANPETAARGGRASKTFGQDKFAAQQHLSEKGKGVVIEVPGEVVACKYCSEFDSCTQKDRLIAEGRLIVE